MRAEFILLLVPVWLCAAPVSGAPCSRVLVHMGSGRLAPQGPYEQRLGFHLDAAGRVWAEASGLSGLDTEDRDAAPEVFLDDTYLGPLLAAFGDAWRSPRALRLGPGEHQLLVRSAQPGGEGPLLRWKSLSVLGDSPCRKEAAPAPARTPGLWSAPCGKLARVRDWPGRLDGGALVLPAQKGRFADSGPLVRLRPGERWSVLMKLPTGPQGGPLPLVVRIAEPSPGRVCFLIWVDRQFRGTVGAVGYTPGRWQALTLSSCSGGLWLRFAGEPPLEYPDKDDAVEFQVAARDLELALSPDNSPD